MHIHHPIDKTAIHPNTVLRVSIILINSKARTAHLLSSPHHFIKPNLIAAVILNIEVVHFLLTKIDDSQGLDPLTIAAMPQEVEVLSKTCNGLPPQVPEEVARLARHIAQLGHHQQ